MTFVLDLGSHTSKIGVVRPPEHAHSGNPAANENPAADLVPTLIGRPKLTSLNRFHRTSNDMKTEELKFGLDCLTRSDLLSISPLIEQGLVQDWDNLEEFLRQMLQSSYGKELATFDEPKLLLVENLGHSKKEKHEKLASIVFESLDFAHFQFTQTPTNILRSHGLLTGLVLDIGDSSTTVSPIYEGFLVEHAVKRSPIGGQALLEMLISNLEANQVVSLRTSYEREFTGRDILMQKSTDNVYTLPDGSKVTVSDE